MGWKFTEKIPVVLLESHQGLRSFLQHLVAGCHQLQLLGEAEDGKTAKALLSELTDSMVIANPLLPPFGAFELLESNPGRNRYLLYCRENPTNVVLDHCLRLQASIVTGHDSTEEIHAALETLLAGEQYLSPTIMSRLRTGPQGYEAEVSAKLRTLTPKRLAVLLLIVAGYSVKEASVALGVSVKSIDSHLDRLRRGLDIRNRVELAMLCLREGLINGHVEELSATCPQCQAILLVSIAHRLQAHRGQLNLTCHACGHEWVGSPGEIEPVCGSELTEPTRRQAG